MNKAISRVGVREFRAHLPQYLLTSLPVAITRHGETIGYYVPARHASPEQAEIEALKHAALQFEKLLSSHGATEEELLSEFRQLKKSDER
jgi:antitoxin (DNA-binding transcriptional repressor) of toxin-antitoxin stability system